MFPLISFLQIGALVLVFNSLLGGGGGAPPTGFYYYGEESYSVRTVREADGSLRTKVDRSERVQTNVPGLRTSKERAGELPPMME